MSATGYVDFLEGLLEDGRVTVPLMETVPSDQLERGDELIAEYESIWRLSLPGTPPTLNPEASRWAAQNLFRASQFTVYRDLGPDLMARSLMKDLSAANASRPEIHYSVDLLFQYLPDLRRFATSAAENDPLLDYFDHWGREWPLSSVGMEIPGKVSISGFAESQSLLQLYVDRILDRNDTARLEDIRVQEAARAALGMFPELHERVSKALATLEPTDHE